MQLRIYALSAGCSLLTSPGGCLGLEPKWHCHFGIPRQRTQLYYVSILMMGCPWGFAGVDILRTSTFSEVFRGFQGFSKALSETLSECHFPLRVAGRVAPNRVAPENSCTPRIEHSPIVGSEKSSASLLGDCHYARPPQNLFPEGIS